LGYLRRFSDFLVLVAVVVIGIVRTIRIHLLLAVLIFSTVTRAFGTRTRIAANHDVRYIHYFGLIELGFTTRRLAGDKGWCFSPVMPHSWLAPASKALILAVLVAVSSPFLPLVRIVVISDFII
jgi:hypothetical protein